MKQNVLTNFCKCGVVGWCLEILFTGVTRHEKSLKCETSLYMFPIYGLAMLISPMKRLLHRHNAAFRGICYTCGIFLTEYATGKLLRRFDRCPWDYSNAPLNVDGLIRLDFAPLWFGTGLLYERLLK